MYRIWQIDITTGSRNHLAFWGEGPIHYNSFEFAERVAAALNDYVSEPKVLRYEADPYPGYKPEGKRP